MSKELKVDFLGIGAARCGTTWISRCLKEHSEICFSSEKEIGFFGYDDEYSRGLEYYKQFFDHCNSGQVKGEFSPGYLKNAEKASKLIYKHFPDVKLIVSLRNPVKRAYSHYFYAKAKERELNDTFIEALKGEKKDDYLDYGKYHTQLQHFLNKFPKENLLIMFYDDMKENPAEFIKKIYSFLGVDTDFQPNVLREKVNASPSSNQLVHIPFLNRTVKYLENKFRDLEGNYLNGIKERLKHIGVGDWARTIRDKNKIEVSKVKRKQTRKPKMDKEVYIELKEFYQKEIEGIEKMTGRNLNQWRQYDSN